jgi:hypothetical protein
MSKLLFTEEQKLSVHKANLTEHIKCFNAFKESNPSQNKCKEPKTKKARK